jgi:serine/threonine protein kinase
MHTLSIIHGDIKCTNIVVKADDNVALIDIGEGGRTEGYYWDDDLRKMGVDFKLKKSGDIYALGVVLLQLMEFRKPVHGEAPVVKRDLQIPSEYCSIVAACVDADDLLRPSALEVLERLSRL